MSDPCDDEEARELRARRLREQIEHLVSGDPEPAPETDTAEAPPPESPRDFIHRKMREWESRDDDPDRE